MTIARRLMLAIVCQLFVLAHASGAEPSRPLIVAHRGLLLHAPENTLPNFRACLELRLGFEFDVQRTKDGQLVCIHDGTVDRTTNGAGKVDELSLSELQALDAGSWFDRGFAGEKPPTIEEVLALVSQYRQRDVLIAVDLKAANVEQEVVRLAEKYKVLDRLLFIGRTITEPSVRRAIKKASSHAHAATVANTPDELPKALADPDSDWAYLRFLPTKSDIEAANRAGRRTFIAGPTVGGLMPENWRQAAEMGIDAILTDYPLDLRTTLRAPALAK